MQNVSIVIPAYNEAARLSVSLPALEAGLRLLQPVEVIVVDDGSTDATADVAVRHLDGWPSATVVRLPWNRGKGAAVRAGVAVATGDVIVFMDADLSADIADLPRLVGALEHADIALGSRAVAGSRAVYERSLRRLSSKVFNDVACGVAGVAASDTQCGFKAFRAPVAKMLFHLGEVDGFAFDVEVLALAELLGYRAAEVAVGWQEEAGGSVRPLRDARRMLGDIVRIRRRVRQLATTMVHRPDPASASSPGVLGGPSPRPAHPGRPELVIDLTDSPGPALVAGARTAPTVVTGFRSPAASH